MRLYRALLRLYPASFRDEYRSELEATFAQRMQGRRSGSPATALAAIADVLPNAAAAHWDILRQDASYGIRSLRKAPGFALTAIAVVALGVGANTAAFSLADFVLLRPLPFHEPERLVKLWQATPGYGQFEYSPGNYRDTRAMATTTQAMGAWTSRARNLVGSAEPRRLETAMVTPELFEVLGVSALAGRTVVPPDSMDGNVIVLGHALWQSHFGADVGILGTSVRLDGEPYTVIGVTPPSFRFPNRGIDAWTPLLLREDDFADRNDNYIHVLARLRDGVTLADARKEFALIASRLEQQYPRENERTGAVVIPLREEMSQRSRALVLALCGAALCILLLACANLASLLLARSTQRGRELAVRAALGAGRERLVRQLVTESIGLAAIGGAVGVALAMAGVPLLAQFVPASLPMADQPSVDTRVLILAIALICLTGLAFGVGPAVAAGRSKALDALRDGARSGGGRTRRIRAGLVITEVAASVVLLICSGLLLRAVLRIQATDPGFRAESVLTLRTALPWPKYAVTARREEFYARVLENVRALPGVQDAAYATGLPMSMRGGIFPVGIAGEEVVAQASNSASLRIVTPAYFRTLGIPLQTGRDVAESDRWESPPVAVVSESFAERHWPGESALGRKFSIASVERTIVGVVGEVRVRGLEPESEPQVYLPSAQMADSSLIAYPPKDLVVRAEGASSLLPAIREIIRTADPEQPVSNVRMLADIVADETASRVTQLRLLGALSLIALLIAGIGIHGLLAFTVSRRAQELGIRRALGEQASSILRRVLREGVMLAAVGVAIGVFAAFLAARAMGALLAGVSPGDPITIALAAALCFATALLGCVRPAIRAARTDPIVALRSE